MFCLKFLNYMSSVYQYLKFDVSIKSSVLIKTSHYSFTQKEIYRITKDLHENHNKNFKEISLYLTQKGYRTVRSNKEFKSNHVVSIYRKVRLEKKEYIESLKHIMVTLELYLISQFNNFLSLKSIHFSSFCLSVLNFKD